MVSYTVSDVSENESHRGFPSPISGAYQESE